MDMTIPAIILFLAMGTGFAMMPSIWRDGVECIKEVIQEYKEEKRTTLW